MAQLIYDEVVKLAPALFDDLQHLRDTGEEKPFGMETIYTARLYSKSGELIDIILINRGTKVANHKGKTYEFTRQSGLNLVEFSEVNK